ncbi:type II toxin-antitoxin system VapB family antitoxin [Congregibacter sp.]|uniref:type II toxin-antitoxin system VapB family antitoxin n=1 Tax=Congregibacter sp. TaxID=2744308 RepID=UPI003F6B0DEB
MSIDDQLFAEARRLTGITENTELIRFAIKRMVEREAARRLACLGGEMPDLEIPGRRAAAMAEDVES